MPRRVRHVAPVPLDWTPDQAEATVDFLQEVLDTLCYVYGDVIEQRRTERREAQYELAIAQAADHPPRP